MGVGRGRGFGQCGLITITTRAAKKREGNALRGRAEPLSFVSIR